MSSLLSSRALISAVSTLIGDFACWLSEVAESDCLLFVSREGYWLDQYFKQVNQRPDIRSCYFPLSRAYLARLSIVLDEEFDWLLAIPFEGSVYEMLNGRFGFALSELLKALDSGGLAGDVLDAPGSNEEAVRLVRDCLVRKMDGQLAAEANLLKARVACHSTGSAVEIADLGYSGTMPRLLVGLLESSVATRFLIQAESSNAYARKVTTRWGAAQWGAGNPILDYSFLLESIFQAPHGGLRSITEWSDRCTLEYSTDVLSPSTRRAVKEFHEKSLLACTHGGSREPLSRAEGEGIMTFMVTLFRMVSAASLDQVSAVDNWRSVSQKSLRVVMA